MGNFIFKYNKYNYNSVNKYTEQTISVITITFTADKSKECSKFEIIQLIFTNCLQNLILRLDQKKHTNKTTYDVFNSIQITKQKVPSEKNLSTSG